MPFRGFKHSEETKRKMIIAHKGKLRPEITQDPKKRLLAGCDRSGGEDSCWPWLRSPARKGGYGQIQYKGRPVYAHRLAWTLFIGPIPLRTKVDGIMKRILVLHTCDNKMCVNPKHLFLGTQKDNMDDMKRKGRENYPIGERTGSAKMTEEKVLEMRSLWATGAYRICDLSRMFGLTHVPVICIVRRKTWKHI